MGRITEDGEITFIIRLQKWDGIYDALALIFAEEWMQTVQGKGGIFHTEVIYG